MLTKTLGDLQEVMEFLVAARSYYPDRIKWKCTIHHSLADAERFVLALPDNTLDATVTQIRSEWIWSNHQLSLTKEVETPNKANYVIVVQIFSDDAKMLGRQFVTVKEAEEQIKLLPNHIVTAVIAEIQSVWTREPSALVQVSAQQ